MKYKWLTAIDLFAGCGGLAVGLQAAGFKILAAAEMKPKARIAFAANFGSTHLYKNVKDLSGRVLLKELELETGQLDLLAACPPCQGFSRLSNRNKVGSLREDPRNDLVLEIIRLASQLKPKCLFLENVPNMQRDGRFHELIYQAQKIGYWIDYGITDAADFGVPQRRERLIWIASLLGPIHLPKRRFKQRTVGDTIADLESPENSSNPLHRMVGRHTSVVQERIEAIPKNGGSLLDAPKKYWISSRLKRGHNGFGDVYGRMSWTEVAPTLTQYCSNPSKGRFLHPEQNRAITPYEAALLQTFPKDYRFPQELGRTAICSMIGEALPPLLAQKQAENIARHISGHKKRRTIK